MAISGDPECGIGTCKPTCMKRFVSIKWFVGFYSLSGLATSSLSLYIVSQITAIERQFGLSSTQTGYLMACNDIGYSATILFAGYFAKKVHIPKILSLSAFVYGLSGIICTIPHFLEKHRHIHKDGDTNVSLSFIKEGVLCSNTSNVSVNYLSVNEADGDESVDVTTSATIRRVAMVIIAMGMILQGMAKAPRFPFMAQYVDDNARQTDTGFYIGIIASVAIFGPALAYGLGSFFSQIYVTLEDVDMNPRDPRWVGAWWLGFLVFGLAALLVAIPLSCFPRRLKYASTKRESEKRHMRQPVCSRVIREIKGFLNSFQVILRIPVYTFCLIGCVLNVLGISSSITFAPKYMEQQFNLTAWHANIITAISGLLSVCIGSFLGGYLTKRIPMNPRKCILLIVSSTLISLVFMAVNMNISCEEPVIDGWTPGNSSLRIPTCSSGCGCTVESFLPLCGSDGRNYFSPCMAGCTTESQLVFHNCSCISGGIAKPGLCPTDCKAIWAWNVANFFGALTASLVMMPTMVIFIRIVPDSIKSLAVSISALCMSLLAWLPGPVIGGKLMDMSCLLWNPGGSCSFYDKDIMRYSMYGWGIGVRFLATLVFIVGLWKAWNMSRWPNAEECTVCVTSNGVEGQDKTKSPEEDKLMKTFT